MPTIHDFAYTGAPQSLVIPAGVESAVLEVWGAAGGSDGGNGAYVKGTTVLTPGETLWVYVGQRGFSYGGGWNGGGNGNPGTASYHGSGGGGATDIRRGGTTLTDRIIVGGGGGGGGMRSNQIGGAGGYPTGGAGGGLLDSGGTQSGPGPGTNRSQQNPPATGTFGLGGSNFGGGTRKIGGGGGGWWGGNSGNGGSSWNYGGGGGSSYYDPALTSVTAEASGTWSAADGKATITLADPVSIGVANLGPLTATGTGVPRNPRRGVPRREYLWVYGLDGEMKAVIV